MTDHSAPAPAPAKALLDAPVTPEKPDTAAVAPLIAQVQAAYGVHPLKQVRDILGLRLGQQKLGSNEYYKLGLYDPAIPRAERAAYLGQGGTNALNKRLNPARAVPAQAFVSNKLLYTQLLDQLGLPTTRTQALVSTSRHAGRLPTLRSADAIAAFLVSADYPLFGKPLAGSLSMGSVRIERIEDDVLYLANGQPRTLDDFAAEVMQRYPHGYLFQTALDPHPDMAALAGPAIASVRVLTAHDGTGVKPVYALWKLPAPTAMSDNFWQDGSLLALLSLEDGRIESCRRGTGLATQWLDTHPQTGAQLTGTRLPFWSETLDLAKDAHRVFADFGACGFDIGITADGPRILECNDNPAHMLYQLAAGKGVAHSAFRPIWDKVAERQKKRVKLYRAAEKKAP
ncbi:MAG: sugar-transfer associated ATP-grasp domain-containing protein [Marinibacterium sp.]